MPDRSDRHGWIDLLVPDGPFLSAAALDVPTVGENWPTRLSAEQRSLLTAPPASEAEEGEGWDDSSWDGRRARVTELLTELLGYREGKTLAVAPGVAAHHHIYRARVSADFVIHAPDDPDDVHMVVICGPDATDDPSHLYPARTHTHNGWVSTPVQRAALLARHADAALALVTNGREHLLVNVVTGTTGSALWTVNGLEDRHVRDAFVALLHKQRVLHRTFPLSKLIERSQDRQRELTDTLGKQVRRAAEALVNAISRANRTSRGRLLEGLTGQQVYAATTRVLMRTVFLLVAEERGLLPVAENQLFADQYAMSTLLDKLEEDAYRNRSAMERRAGAWQRMMALSRAVHAGIEHDDLRLPAYGGKLFDPDEHPFLEARVAAADGEGFEQLDVGVVDDFTVLTVLRHLQVAGGQRISFRSLDVEQIGHVYEALLDHSAVIVPEDQIAVLGLIGKAGNEPEVSLVELEGWTAKSDEELGKKLVDLGVAAEAKGVYQAIDDGLAPDSEVAQTLNVAVANDPALRERVERYAPLLRTDARGIALVFRPGDVYVTETSSKRDSGTAYTPRSLADEIAKHTLDPLIYDPGPQNELDESKWRLKTPEQILDLKICDPAVGSAAILVAAIRYLAEALLQARVGTGELSAEALASGAADAESVDVRVQARRAIVSRCVYGVDRDPMAVEMAKLSLWLITMARDEPFTFLDHAVRHGDSLLGITSIDELLLLHPLPSRVRGSGKGQQMELGADPWVERVETAVAEMSQARRDLAAMTVTGVAEVAEQDKLLRVAERRGRELQLVADAIIATSLAVDSDHLSDLDARLSALQPLVARLPATDGLVEGSSAGLKDRSCLHWPLEFPEVFAQGRRGFDALIANPPFVGGVLIGQSFGGDYFAHLGRVVAEQKTNRSDLVALFFRRATRVAHRLGFLSTDSITAGDSREVALAGLVGADWRIVRARPPFEWPGAQNLHVVIVWASDRSELCYLRTEDKYEQVEFIGTRLTKSRRDELTPQHLKQASVYFCKGVIIGSKEHELTQEEVNSLPATERTAVRRVFGASELLRGSSDRYVAHFTHRDPARAAEEFPAIMRIAGERMRDTVTAKGKNYSAWKVRWHTFWNPRDEMWERIEVSASVFALPEVATHPFPMVLPEGALPTHKLYVFAAPKWIPFAATHSFVFQAWVKSEAGRRGANRIAMNLDDCIKPFPFDQLASEDLSETGKKISEIQITALRAEEPLKDLFVDLTDLRPRASSLREAVLAVDESICSMLGVQAEHGPSTWIDGATRFGLTDECEDEVLDALYELNRRSPR